MTKIGISTIREKMSLTEKKYGFSLGEHWVEVIGETKTVNPRWSLLVDKNIVDSKTKTGEFVLNATVDKSHLEVRVDQGSFGGVKIEVMLDDRKIQEHSGFLA